MSASNKIMSPKELEASFTPADDLQASKATARQENTDVFLILVSKNRTGRKRHLPGKQQTWCLLMTMQCFNSVLATDLTFVLSEEPGSSKTDTRLLPASSSSWLARCLECSIP